MDMNKNKEDEERKKKKKQNKAGPIRQKCVKHAILPWLAQIN